MAKSHVNEQEKQAIASVVQRLRELQGNHTCADCEKCDCDRCGPADASWLSEDLQVLVCQDCKILHEKVTRADFKCITDFHEWTIQSIQAVSLVSNERTNNRLEKDLPIAYRRPTRCFDRRFREHWINTKYVKKQFFNRSNQPRYLGGMKSGYLWKRGRGDKLFQKRWFVLDVEDIPMLKYYIDHEERQLRGEIKLLDLDLCLASEDKIDNENAMQLLFPETKGNTIRVIYLYAEAAKEMVEWYEAVRIRKYIQLETENPTMEKTKISSLVGDDILKEGYLLKTGRKGSEAFRKRWMVLHGKRLLYFKEPLDANPKGVIMLDSEISVILSGLEKDSAQKGYHFKLRTPGRTYHLIAEEDFDRQIWIKAIHQACNKDRSPATLPRPGIKRNEKPGSSGSLSSDTRSSVSYTDSEDDIIELIDYHTLSSENIISDDQWVSNRGLSVNEQVLTLKVPPHGIDVGDITTAAISTSVLFINVQEISGTKVHGTVSPVFKCKSSDPVIGVLHPIQLELQHCAILSEDSDKVNPVLWKKQEDEDEWKKVKDSDLEVSCKVRDHSFVISSMYFSSFAVTVEGEGVLGKRLKCAAFCSEDRQSENEEIRVYIVNDDVSGLFWQNVLRREKENGFDLLDESPSFAVLEANGALMISIQDLQGLQVFPGSFSTLKIPYQDVWCKAHSMYFLEFIKTAPSGFCQLLFVQERHSSSQVLAYLDLCTSSETKGAFASAYIPQHVSLTERRPTPHYKEQPIPRHFSDSHAKEKSHFPHTRHANSSHDSSSSSSHEKEQASSSAHLPFTVKQKLATLLDGEREGHNWRALAHALGINSTLCEGFTDKVSPAMEVFKYVEYVDLGTDDLQEALRDIQQVEGIQILEAYLNRK